MSDVVAVERRRLNAALVRIGYPDDTHLSPTRDVLFDVHGRVRRAFPYENLSVYGKGAPIRLDIASLFEKMVVGRRGGFCLELNTLYGWVLERLGFDVSVRSAKVMLAIAELGDPLDRVATHMILLVRVPLSNKVWLCDNGCVKAPITPLELVDGSSCGIAGGDRVQLQARRVDSIQPHQWRVMITDDKLGPGFIIFCLFDDIDVTDGFKRAFDRVIQPEFCPPGPGVEVVAVPDAENRMLMLIGSPQTGYTFQVRGTDGIVQESRKITGGVGAREQADEIIRMRFNMVI